MKSLIASLSILLAASVAGAEPIIIRNVTVLSPAATPGIDVVVEGGTITAVAKGAAAPRGATVIDGTNKFVTAGLIDPMTQLGLVEVSMVSEANDGRPSSATDDKVHAAYRVIDGYNEASIAIPIARLGGITTVGAMPEGSLIAGQAALMSLGNGNLEESTIRAPLYMTAQLGGDTLGGTPSRGVVVERLREILNDARVYADAKSRFERNQMRRLSAERLDLEALAPVLKGTLPLLIEAHRASDIRAAISLAKEQRVRVIIAGGAEAWVVADELAAAKIPVITDPLMNIPSSFDRTRTRDDNIGLLVAAGVRVAISTLGSTANVRRLRQLAGNAVTRGLSPEQALAAITKAPAEIFAIAKRGAVRPGHVADLVLWSGDPLELSSQPEAILIGGEAMPLKSRQTLLRDRYR